MPTGLLCDTGRPSELPASSTVKPTKTRGIVRKQSLLYSSLVGVITTLLLMFSQMASTTEAASVSIEAPTKWCWWENRDLGVFRTLLTVEVLAHGVWLLWMRVVPPSPPPTCPAGWLSHTPGFWAGHSVPSNNQPHDTVNVTADASTGARGSAEPLVSAGARQGERRQWLCGRSSRREQRGSILWRGSHPSG
jgi:hypothetical protein